jgi:anti-sigma regulatory factor (Ser/Thr protein kinase)
MDNDRAQREAGPGRPDVTPAALLVLEQDFDASSLYALRSAVAAHAAAAGVSPLRVYDVVTAAHELAANAVRHGAGHGCLRLQAVGAVLTCQVTDDGPAPASEDTKPETTTATWPAEHSHGLWLIGQIADQLTIDHGPAGTTATATFSSPQ